MSNNKISGIYCIQNTENGKKYVGKSKNIKHRWTVHKSHLNRNIHSNVYLQRAWNKYGKDGFEFRILEECDECLLPDKEIEHMKKLNATNSKYGYNLVGNTQYGVDFNEDKINAMRIANKDVAIPIFQISFSGEIVEWEYGARQASKCLNLKQSNIWACVNNKHSTYSGYIWIAKSEYDRDTFDVMPYINASSRLKPVIQFDKNKKEIGRFSSPKEAEISTGIDSNSIGKCARGKYATAGECYWVYLSDYLKENYIFKSPNKTRVNQYDISRNFIKTWDSIADIVNCMNISEGSIRDCCLGIRNIGHNFIWEYYDEDRS